MLLLFLSISDTIIILLSSHSPAFRVGLAYIEAILMATGGQGMTLLLLQAARAHAILPGFTLGFYHLMCENGM